MPGEQGEKVNPCAAALLCTMFTLFRPAAENVGTVREEISRLYSVCTLLAPYSFARSSAASLASDTKPIGKNGAFPLKMAPSRTDNRFDSPEADSCVCSN